MFNLAVQPGTIIRLSRVSRAAALPTVKKSFFEICSQKLHVFRLQHAWPSAINPLIKQVSCSVVRSRHVKMHAHARIQRVSDESQSYLDNGAASSNSQSAAIKKPSGRKKSTEGSNRKRVTSVPPEPVSSKVDGEAVEPALDGQPSETSRPKASTGRSRARRSRIAIKRPSQPSTLDAVNNCIRYESDGEPYVDRTGLCAGKLHWFALQVVAGKEKAFAKYLEREVAVQLPGIPFKTWVPEKTMLAFSIRAEKMTKQKCIYGTQGWLFVQCILDQRLLDVIMGSFFFQRFRNILPWRFDFLEEDIELIMPCEERFIRHVEEWVHTEENEDKAAVYGPGGGPIVSASESAESKAHLMEVIETVDFTGRVVRKRQLRDEDGYKGTFNNPSRWYSSSDQAAMYLDPEYDPFAPALEASQEDPTATESTADASPSSSLVPKKKTLGAEDAGGTEDAGGAEDAMYAGGPAVDAAAWDQAGSWSWGNSSPCAVEMGHSGTGSQQWGNSAVAFNWEQQGHDGLVQGNDAASREALGTDHLWGFVEPTPWERQTAKKKAAMTAAGSRAGRSTARQSHMLVTAAQALVQAQPDPGRILLGEAFAVWGLPDVPRPSPKKPLQARQQVDKAAWAPAGYSAAGAGPASGPTYYAPPLPPRRGTLTNIWKPGYEPQNSYDSPQQGARQGYDSTPQAASQGYALQGARRGYDLPPQDTPPDRTLSRVNPRSTVQPKSQPAEQDFHPPAGAGSTGEWQDESAAVDQPGHSSTLVDQQEFNGPYSARVDDRHATAGSPVTSPSSRAWSAELRQQLLDALDTDPLHVLPPSRPPATNERVQRSTSFVSMFDSDPAGGTMAGLGPRAGAGTGVNTRVGSNVQGIGQDPEGWGRRDWRQSQFSQGQAAEGRNGERENRQQTGRETETGAGLWKEKEDQIGAGWGDVDLQAQYYEQVHGGDKRTSAMGQWDFQDSYSEGDYGANNEQGSRDAREKGDLDYAGGAGQVPRRARDDRRPYSGRDDIDASSGRPTCSRKARGAFERDTYAEEEGNPYLSDQYVQDRYAAQDPYAEDPRAEEYVMLGTAGMGDSGYRQQQPAVELAVVPGQEIEVVSGDFKGFYGVVQSVQGGSVIAQLQVFGQETSAKVPAGAVVAIDESRPK